MPLPARRLAYLLHAKRDQPWSLPLDWLIGTTVLLPGDLPRAEREEICDIITTFLNKPVRMNPRTDTLVPECIHIITEPVDQAPDAVKDGVVVAVAAIKPGRRRLGIPNVLRNLRDAVLMALDKAASTPKEREIGTWAQAATDSPSTALRFVSGAQRLYLLRPYSLDVEFAALGLAETIAWLCTGVDTRILEWVIAHALSPHDKRRLLSPEAALLDERLAFQRALGAGLVERLPDHDEYLDLRRPFALLAEPGEVVAGLTLEMVRAALAPLVDVSILAVFNRFVQTRPKSLQLSGPYPPPLFVGRKNELAYILRLFEPTHEVRMVVVHGLAGIGKTALASIVCKHLEERLEPVWLTFVNGPEIAWRRVADGLGTAEGPNWRKRTFRAIAERNVLLVIEDVDGMPESELSEWLPGGTGPACVLVSSRQPQPVLQDEHDAFPVALGPLDDNDARALLLSKRPALADAMQRGEVDGLIARLEGNPLAIGVASGLLESQSIDEIANLLGQGPAPTDILTRRILESVDAQLKPVMEALAMCAPSGAPKALLQKMLGVDDIEAALGQLAAEGFVDTGERRVRLHGIVHMVVERELPETRRFQLEKSHALASDELMRMARKGRDDALWDDVYRNALVALERMIAICQKQGNALIAKVLGNLASEIDKYPRKSPAICMPLIIHAWKTVLTIFIPDREPDRWASVQIELGSSLLDLQIGDRQRHVHEAIEAYSAVLSTIAKDDFPREWASAQCGLGIAYGMLANDDNDDEAKMDSIQEFEEALTVFTKATHPEDWAMVQSNLAVTYRSLARGKRGEYWDRAQRANESALEIYNRADYPHGWARVQYNLGVAWMNLREGNRAQNLHNAITHYHAALEVFTPQSDPRGWAQAQANIGSAWIQLPKSNRGANVQQALMAYRLALTVLSKNEYPYDWAVTQENIGAVLLEIQSDDPRATLNEAITALQSSLTVYTHETHPREHTAVHELLAKAYAKLAALGKT